ncbi:MAG TPA: ABC transporter ATP-binding protein [Thermomicrobiales bacterium]|nr:ABC transporter ATP-binding protein [Thermomicrobiales bacterium]
MSARATPEPVITASALTKRYGNVVALDGVDVSMPRAATGLLGANGSGKSTFIKLLLGLIQPTSGAATIFGLDAAGEAVRIRERVGYMPESDCLPLDVTAADFVAHMAEMSGLPSQAARQRANDILYQVGVDEERYRLIRGFSTGMKQRVKLAQAIVHDPELVFLDEPTNGMDPQGRDDMLDLIRRIYRTLGIAVIVSSHLLEDIERVCDHVVMVNEGRLVIQGRIDDLLEGGGDIIVRIDGDRDEFITRLRARGSAAAIAAADIVVAIGSEAPEAVYDRIRDTVVDMDVPLRLLRGRERSLEDVYIQTVGGLAGEEAMVAGGE